MPKPTGHDKTSIVCFQRADHPGSLHGILGQFAARNINLTKLESRPTKQALGDYCFVIDLAGHVGDEVVADCLRDLHAGLAGVKFLGSYPAAGEHGPEQRRQADAAWQAADDWLRRGPAATASSQRRRPRSGAGTLRREGRMALPIIDVDQHLFESRTTWSDFIEPAHRADALSITDDAGRLAVADLAGRTPHPARGADPRALVAHRRRPSRAGCRGERAPASFEELVPDAYRSAGARLASLDEFGLDAAVMFPNYGLLWEQRLASDRDAQRANARAYNRFVAGVCADGAGSPLRGRPRDAARPRLGGRGDSPGRGPKEFGWR